MVLKLILMLCDFSLPNFNLLTPKIYRFMILMLSTDSWDGEDDI